MSVNSAVGSPEPVWPGPSGAPLSAMIKELGRTLSGDDDRTNWRTWLSTELEPLRRAFAEHRAVTEGERGIYADLVHDAPRLARTVDDLIAEHDRLDSAMTGLARAAENVAADADVLLRKAIDVLRGLDRHRKSDAKLVLEAYVTDIGGE